MAQITLNSSGVASSGSLLLQTNGTTTQATVDTSGNLGLGVTPSAWGSGWKALELGFGSFGGYSTTQLYLTSNAYQDGTNWKYKTSSQAAQYQHYQGAHYWNTAASGTAGNTATFSTSMTLDASGNLAIGTTSAATLLTLQKSAGEMFRAIVSSNTALYASIGADGNGGWINGSTNLYFSTGGSERARIDSSGNLLIASGALQTTAGNVRVNTDSSTGTLTVFGTVTPRFDNNSSVGTSSYRWSAIYAANGTIQTSDGREKNTVQNSVLGLEFINALRPVSYKWNIGENVVTYDEDGNQVVTPRAGTRTHFGFIAQEVKEVLGEQDFGGYVEEPNGRLGLRYDQFVAPLVKAIQELNAKFEAYKAAHP